MTDRAAEISLSRLAGAPKSTPPKPLVEPRKTAGETSNSPHRDQPFSPISTPQTRRRVTYPFHAGAMRASAFSSTPATVSNGRSAALALSGRRLRSSRQNPLVPASRPCPCVPGGPVATAFGLVSRDERRAGGPEASPFRSWPKNVGIVASGGAGRPVRRGRMARGPPVSAIARAAGTGRPLASPARAGSSHPRVAVFVFPQTPSPNPTTIFVIRPALASMLV